MNPVIALVGNPNCGKTTLFNSLTGLRQKVGNYPGVTVERKEGSLSLPSGDSVTLIDLPGLYSLTPHSPDEQIARDALLGYLADSPRPEAILNVVDASNLERNLYLTSQLADLGLPILVALTMGDTAARRGLSVDATALTESLGVPVIPIHAASRAGIQELIRQLGSLGQAAPPPRRRWQLPSVVEEEALELAELLTEKHQLRPEVAFAEAVALLGMQEGPRHVIHRERWDDEIQNHLNGDQRRLAQEGVDTVTLIAEARYADIGRIVSEAVHRLESPPITITERLDRVFLHRFWGYCIFLGLMLVLFQAMFSWAEIPKGWIEQGMNALSGSLKSLLPAGIVRELLVDGALSGVGNTVVFLPQIVLLFLFISLLEDTGYLARAAFLMDRVMSRVGLHGKSFIPLLSSYACAIPGILATRTIESPKARLLTILVAPLMSCSARLPVYGVLIAAFIPSRSIVGFHLGSYHVTLLTPQALVLFSMYALGTVAVYVMAALFNRILLKGEAPSFLLEMPPYRKPQLRTVLYRMWETTLQFLQRAGTVILAISTVLWFLANHPRQPEGTAASLKLERSYAGQLGKVIEPIIRPLGFDWKMGIGLVSSFAAREVFVSTMSIIYSAEAEDDEQTSIAVREQMKQERDAQGKPVYTPLVAICLMVFYVLAMQCMSTVAVVKRETNGWKWPLFQVAYMTLLAWSVTFLVRVIGVALGYGT